LPLHYYSLHHLQPQQATIQDPTIAQQRIEIDEEIDRLLAQVDELKRRRNNLSFAFRLPGEIICAILLECRNMGLSYNTQIDSEAHDLRWVSTATELCVPWRAAALAYPALWDHVEYKFNSRSIAPRMIKLAHGRLLNVAVRLNERVIGALRLEK
jgi:hypothetical protein